MPPSPEKPTKKKAIGGTGLSANGDNIDLFVAGDAAGSVRDNLSLVGGWTEAGTFNSATITGSATTFTLYVVAGSQIAVQDGLDVTLA